MAKKTFLDFFNESEALGNYVSIDTNINFPDGLDKYDGKITPSAHCTIMYSKNSNIPLDKVQALVDTFPTSFIGVCNGIDIFDDDDYSCVVLRIDAPELYSMNEKLTSIGLKHSYDYNPHITCMYKLTHKDARAVRDFVKRYYVGKVFTFSNYNNNYVVKDWVDKG